MNKVSIIVDDLTVIVDGEARVVDSLDVLKGKNPLHAVQWDNDSKSGTLEYKDGYVREINKTSEFKWSQIKTLWNKAKGD